MQRFGTLMACETVGSYVEVRVRLQYPTAGDESALKALLGESVLVAVNAAYQGCPGCGAGFVPAREGQRHCSDRCRQRAHRRRDTTLSDPENLP